MVDVLNEYQKEMKKEKYKKKENQWMMFVEKDNALQKEDQYMDKHFHDLILVY